MRLLLTFTPTRENLCLAVLCCAVLCACTPLSAVPSDGQVVVSHVQASIEGKRKREGLSESKSLNYRLWLVYPQLWRGILESCPIIIFKLFSYFCSLSSPPSFPSSPPFSLSFSPLPFSFCPFCVCLCVTVCCVYECSLGIQLMIVCNSAGGGQRTAAGVRQSSPSRLFETGSLVWGC